ncbi:hypothetical protein CANMA_003440 [Candida margitis]|uniref:uncharacterized protein n=1 Tax=Candida margitis TaxID=1775924 RepID=UPI00222798B4|nr:uncharacterized protein CANMA_003440 [Candida margitis]KAI5964930.1 hypothetical protein CANMA_003440 [Candida margitis]
MSQSIDSLSYDQLPPEYTPDDTPLSEQPTSNRSSKSHSKPKLVGQTYRERTPVYGYSYGPSPAYTASILVVGDTGVGKASLMWSYKYRKPSTCRNCPEYKEFSLERKRPDDVPFLLKVSHEGGDVEDLAKRDVETKPYDIVLLCFAIDNVESLLNVRDKWFPQLKQQMGSEEIPIILVGTKVDLATSIPLQFVDEICEHIGAIEYKECSAKNDYDVQCLFHFTIHRLHDRKYMDITSGTSFDDKYRKEEGSQDWKAVTDEKSTHKAGQTDQSTNKEKKKKKKNSDCVVM